MSSTSAAAAATLSPPDRLMQLSSGFMLSSALNAIARLGVADALAAGPLTSRQLSERLNVCPDALERVMRLLCGAGVFDEADGAYSLTALSDLLRKDAPDSILDTVAFICDPLHLRLYADMVPTIRDGRSASEHSFGKGIFDVFAEDGEAQTRFNRAMTSMSRRVCNAVLASYDFSGISSLVDVAGGQGMLLSAILDRYPQLQGVLFDLPHVIDQSHEQISAVRDRCRTVSGDFFSSVPTGQVILMKHIIHDWDDEKALIILKNCRKALAGQPGAKLLLIELLLSAEPGMHFSKVLDVEMLMLPGGRERTREQYARLLAAAGFNLTQVIDTRTNYVIIEAAPV